MDNQTLSITLEVTSEDPNVTSAADAYAVGRDSANALRNDGYTIQPVYTGQRGGEFLVDVVFPLLNTIWTQKDMILTDVSALVTILTPVVTVVQYLREAHERRVGKETAREHPLKITLEIGEARLSLESSDQEGDVLAEHLAKQLLASYPHIQVIPQTKPKVMSRVPKTQQRKRR